MPRKLRRFKTPITVSQLGHAHATSSYTPPGESWRALFRARAHEETARPTERNEGGTLTSSGSIKLVCHWSSLWAELVNTPGTYAITKLPGTAHAETLAIKSVVREVDVIEKPYAVITCERTTTAIPAEGLVCT